MEWSGNLLESGSGDKTKKSDDVESPRISGGALEILAMSLKMGLMAFGGPVAHVAMMEREIIAGRKWVKRDHFMDLLALTNLVPGPNSTQMIMHVGFIRGGDAGNWLAGLGFILPAFLITLGLSRLYVTAGQIPAVESLFYGIKPAIVALIATALWRMIGKNVRHLEAGIIFVLATVAAALGVNELIVMGAGALYGLGKSFKPERILSLAPLTLLLATAGNASLPFPVPLARLGLLFLRFGATLYGSGYLLIAFIQHDLVERLGWLTNQQLLDAIAIGQMTPGPILTTSTAVGYITAGSPGAVVATVAIFLPSFLFVSIVGRFIPALRQSATARYVLDGILPAVLGVLTVVAFNLASAALVDVTA
ncbi:MAG: chromate efflux transporter, partial [Clostridia bacterium]